MPRGLAAGSVLALFLQVAAAAPTPSPDLQALGTILAGPPDSSWKESPISTDTLEGPFGATFYVETEWSDQSDRDNIRNQLVADGFIGGFGRTFEKSLPAEYITEDVKAFPDAAHAMSNYRWVMDYFHDASDTANNILTPAIPNSFGERYTIDPWHSIDIYFTKANYVFTVTVGGKADYMPDIAVRQANAVYNRAPSRDVLQPSPRPAGNGSMAPAVAIVGGGAAAVILAVLLAAALLIVLLRRRKPAPSAAPQAMLSPDGNYWWDGSTWQPVRRS